MISQKRAFSGGTGGSAVKYARREKKAQALIFQGKDRITPDLGKRVKRCMT